MGAVVQHELFAATCSVGCCVAHVIPALHRWEGQLRETLDRICIKRHALAAERAARLADAGDGGATITNIPLDAHVTSPCPKCARPVQVFSGDSLPKLCGPCHPAP